MLHTGPIMSAVPGRTDKHNISVRSGSYILPADFVSNRGQNNTVAGAATLGRMFSSGPYGAKPMGITRGKLPAPPKVRADGGEVPPRGVAPVDGLHQGMVGGDDELVPIVVAGGEFLIDPDHVRMIGQGDIEHGHNILDQWVLSDRKKHIETLRGLPKPAKS